LLFEQRPQALRHLLCHSFERPYQGPVSRLLRQHPTRHQCRHQGDQKQRIAVGVLVQPPHQGLRELMPREARREIRRHRGRAQRCQRELGAVTLPLQVQHDGAQRVPLPDHFHGPVRPYQEEAGGRRRASIATRSSVA
jgi:hypothetical protein